MQLAGKPAFWLAMLLGITAALLPNLAWQGIRRTYFPSDANLIQVTPLPTPQPTPQLVPALLPTCPHETKGINASDWQTQWQTWTSQ